jgi:hypothetical protein
VKQLANAKHYKEIARSPSYGAYQKQKSKTSGVIPIHSILTPVSPEDGAA